MEPEYELLQKHLSGVVHSSCYALKEGPLVRGFLLADWAWRFSFRILGKFAEYLNVVLEEHEAEFVGAATENVFGDSSSKS